LAGRTAAGDLAFTGRIRDDSLATFRLAKVIGSRATADERGAGA